MSKPSPKAALPEPEKSGAFRFRLVHVVYVITALASALATFGPAGTLPGIFVCGFWASVFTSRRRPRALLHACWATLGIALLLLLLLPAVNSAREASRRMQCSNNLRQIALALHNYHDTYGCFPPAYLADRNGKPMHSWRVLILPFIEQSALYQKYDFSEPWDGPKNSKLLSSMPHVYSCPSVAHTAAGRSTCTSYLAVVGPTTVWPGRATRSLNEITDGATNTALVVEHDDGDIPWLAPRDLELDSALAILTSVSAGSHGSQDFFYQYFSGRNVTFADGSVRFVSNGVGRDVWSAILGANDGVTWGDEDVQRARLTLKRLRIGNCVRLGVFIALTLFPLPWVWLNPTSGTPGAAVGEASS